jgi:purine-binding chemotaxis protein CheW
MSNPTHISLLLLKVGSSTFGVNVLEIQEIMACKGRALSMLPPDHSLGFCSLRGDIFPVVDLSVLLEQPSEAALESKSIVVLRQGNSLLGALVDSVTTIRNMPVSAFKENPGTQVQNSFVCKTAECDGTPVQHLTSAQLFELNMSLAA